MDQVVTVIAGKGKAAAWKRTFLMDADGALFAAARHVGDEDALVEMALAEGVLCLDHLDHAFLPVTWLARVVPSHAQRLARALSMLRAGLVHAGRHMGAGADLGLQADLLTGSQIDVNQSPQKFALAGAGSGPTRSEANRAWTSRVSAIRSAGQGGTQL
jgi:hypothetical protein